MLPRDHPDRIQITFDDHRTNGPASPTRDAAPPAVKAEDGAAILNPSL